MSYSAYGILSQDTAKGPFTYKLLQCNKRLKVLEHYIVCTWERGRARHRTSPEGRAQKGGEEHEILRGSYLWEKVRRGESMGCSEETVYERK